MGSRIKAISHYLGADKLTYDELKSQHPDWDTARLTSSLGIEELPRAPKDEFSSHLAIGAANRLFEQAGVDRKEIDFVLLVTQSPDFPLPTTACIVQNALGLRQEIGALDVRLGCSGYVYALGLAKGLIQSNQARNVLLLTADVLSKLVNDQDKATAPVFADAGTATLVTASETENVGGFVYGTDGSGAGALLVPNGSVRPGAELNASSAVEARELTSQGYDLYMDGTAVFGFTLATVPPLVDETLAKNGWAQDDVDLFVFHQANAFMLQRLRKKLRIPEDRFWLDMTKVGNTGPSTIPVALSQAAESGRITAGSRLLLAGFGVGLSWAGVTLTW